ncbi:MAG: hypothetical protein AMXMBFR33_12710 [Candidatus Xenobia bacterium]
MTGWLLLMVLAGSLAAWRATLSLRARLRILLSGAVVGALAVPLAHMLVGRARGWADWLSFLVLLWPALAVLSPRHRLRFSVADGFLLGFLAGLGYDLYAVSLAGGAVKFAWLPLVKGQPWSGYAFGCGLAGLALVAGRRFTLAQAGGWVWCLAALAVATVDRMQLVRLDPRIFPCLALAIAFVLGEREQRWLRRSPVYAQLKSLPDLAVPALQAGLFAYLRAARRRRQVMLERAELVKMGNTSFFALPRQERWSAPPDLPALLLGAAAFLSLLAFPASLGATPLATFLPAAGILWCFLRLPELEPEEADRVACTRAEELTVNCGLLLVVLCLVAGVGSAGPFAPAFSVSSYALVVALAASTLTGTQRAEAAALRTATERRMNWVHRGLLAAKTVLVALGCAWLFGGWKGLLAPIVADSLPGWSIAPAAVALFALLGAIAAGFLNAFTDRVESALRGGLKS